jgi:hypothetical protein
VSAVSRAVAPHRYAITPTQPVVQQSPAATDATAAAFEALGKPRTKCNQEQKAQAMVATRYEWRVPSGKPTALWPWPYSRGRGAGREHAHTFIAPVAHVWFDAQREAPFAGQAEYAADRPRCEHAYRAAAFWPAQLELPEQLPRRIALMSLLDDGRVHMLPETDDDEDADGASEVAVDGGAEADAVPAAAVGATRVGGGSEGAAEDAAPSVRVAFAAFAKASAQLWAALALSGQQSVRRLFDCGSRRRA